VAQFDDGRSALVTVGTRRIRVERWLDDDPYPRAEVIDLHDEPAGPEAPVARDGVGRLLRRVLALRTELGERAAEATTDLDDDPTIAAYQACALAPLGPLDGQALLAASGADDRLRLLHRLLTDEAAVLTQQLGGG
jgi:Lon protease-like protein